MDAISRQAFLFILPPETRNRFSVQINDFFAVRGDFWMFFAARCVTLRTIILSENCSLFRHCVKIVHFATRAVIFKLMEPPYVCDEPKVSLQKMMGH